MMNIRISIDDHLSYTLTFDDDDLGISREVKSLSCEQIVWSHGSSHDPKYHKVVLELE